MCMTEESGCLLRITPQQVQLGESLYGWGYKHAHAIFYLLRSVGVVPDGNDPSTCRL